MLSTKNMLLMVKDLHFDDNAIDFETMLLLIQKIKDVHDLKIEDILLHRCYISYDNGGTKTYVFTYEGEKYIKSEIIDIDGYPSIDIHDNLVRLKDIKKDENYVVYAVGD